MKTAIAGILKTDYLSTLTVDVPFLWHLIYVFIDMLEYIIKQVFLVHIHSAIINTASFWRNALDVIYSPNTYINHSEFRIIFLSDCLHAASLISKSCMDLYACKWFELIVLSDVWSLLSFYCVDCAYSIVYFEWWRQLWIQFNITATFYQTDFFPLLLPT